MSTDEQIKKDIYDWAIYVGLPQKSLGGLSVCPFAKASMNLYEVQIVDNVTLITPPNRDFELIIYVIRSAITIEELNKACAILKEQNPLIEYLPDHSTRNTYIGEAQTNNGKHNLILCQPMNKLLAARNKIAKTNYYKFWDAEYLNEIFGKSIN
jgi:hypothetical protein